MESKKILLFTYSKANLGDDLFVYILAKKYSDVEFFVHINDERYKKAFQNLKNLKCLEDAREVKKVNIDDYDAFIYVGGSIFIESEYGRHEAREFNKFIKRVKEKNKPFFYMNCNFGPYMTEEYLNQIRENLEMCEGVCFRDKLSYDLFKDIDSVKCASDLAFLYDYNSFIKLKEKKSIGISVIDVSIREKLKDKELIYLDYIKRIIIKFAKRGYKISLVSFCDFENDEIAIEKIMQQIPNEYKKNVTKLLYKGDLERFLEEYSKFEYMVCTRFHAMILSIIFRQKIYNLIYSDKTKNFINDYRLFRKIDKIENLQFNTYLRMYHFKRVKRFVLNKLKRDSFGQVDLFENWINE